MSETDEDEEAEPAVQLGDGRSVEGAPLARVVSRLHYPIEKSEVDRREGETTVRTPDGPRELGDVLAASEEVYFPTDNDLRAAVEDVVGTGPVPTDDDGGATTEAAEPGEIGDAETDADGADAETDAEVDDAAEDESDDSDADAE